MSFTQPMSSSLARNILNSSKVASVLALSALSSASFKNSDFNLPGVYKDIKPCSLTSKAVPDRYAVIDLTDQMAYLFIYNPNEERFAFIKEFRVTTGQPQKDGGCWTPEGTFYTGKEGRLRYSTSYGNAPMPNYVHIYKGIYAHRGKLSPTLARDSHGCIRFGAGDDKFFQEFCHEGTAVHIKKKYEVPSAEERLYKNITGAKP